MSRKPSVMVSIIFALFIHLGIACAVLWKTDMETVPFAEIAQGMSITLDQNTYQNILRKEQQKQQKTMVKKEVPKPIELKKIKPKKQKKVKVIHQKVINEKLASEAVTYQVQEEMVKKIKPVKEPVSENIKVASTTNTPIQTMQAEPVNAQQKSVEGVNGLASQKPIDMSDGATKRYLAKLMRHLKRYQQYPALLKKNHVEGKPVIRFSINRRGQVTNVEVKKRTKYAELDQAAMDVFRRASPLPKIPSELERETLTMSLPMEYSLIND